MDFSELLPVLQGAQSPALLVLVWVCWNQHKTLEKMTDAFSRVRERLVAIETHLDIDPPKEL